MRPPVLPARASSVRLPCMLHSCLRVSCVSCTHCPPHVSKHATGLSPQRLVAPACLTAPTHPAGPIGTSPSHKPTTLRQLPVCQPIASNAHCWQNCPLTVLTNPVAPLLLLPIDWPVPSILRQFWPLVHLAIPIGLRPPIFGEIVRVSPPVRDTWQVLQAQLISDNQLKI